MAKRYAVPPAVYVLLERPVDDKAEYLFMRRNGTGYMDGKWGLPAGHLDPDEALAAAATREVEEETGLIVLSRTMELVHVMHTAPEVPNDYSDQRIDFYFRTLAPPGSEPIISEPTKCDAMDWFTLETPPSPLVPRVEQALQYMAKHMIFSEVNWDK